MPSRNSKSLLIFAILGIGIVGGLGAYVKMSGTGIPPEEHREQNPGKKLEPPKVDVKSHEETQALKSFVPHFSESGDLSFTTKPLTVPDGEDARVYAVNHFLQETKVAPAEAKLMSIDVHDGIATLSFNKAFFDGYGTDDERTLVEGLQKTLGQFKEIQTLDFRNEGAKVESLGNIELSGMKVERS